MNKNPINFSYLPSKLHYNGNLSPIKPRQKMPTIYRHRYSYSIELEDNLRWQKDNSYLKKRLNNQVELQRSSMIMKTGRMSEDSPHWMTIHSDYYKKDNSTPVRKLSMSEQKNFDILNNKKNLFDGRNQDSYYISMNKNPQQMKQSSKYSKGFEIRRTLNHLLKNQSEVTQKVGYVTSRDHTIYRPQLKVGSNAFIDTYSPF